MPDSQRHVNYDEIAGTYNRRFDANPQNQLAGAILCKALALPGARLLEVGCGTGRWLASLNPAGKSMFGLDLSMEMLRQAQARDGQIRLVQGRAERLPFPVSTFGLVYCVNALHHFSRPKDFIHQAYDLLVPGGVLAFVGMDPNDFTGASPDPQWYVYQYFEGTLEADLARFPSRSTIASWMAEAGFQDCKTNCTERILANEVGWSVFEDAFLDKNSTSQLILLSDEAYNEGLNRIKEALTAADQKGESLVFPVDICIYMTTGKKKDIVR